MRAAVHNSLIKKGVTMKYNVVKKYFEDNMCLCVKLKMHIVFPELTIKYIFDHLQTFLTTWAEF